MTWRNGRMGVRLHRCLININWRTKFHEASVVHLRWLKSDHHPLLLRLDGTNYDNKHRQSFRFEVA